MVRRRDVVDARDCGSACETRLYRETFVKLALRTCIHVRINGCCVGGRNVHRLCKLEQRRCQKGRACSSLGGMSLEPRHAMRDLPRTDTTQADNIMWKHTASHYAVYGVKVYPTRPTQM